MADPAMDRRIASPDAASVAPSNDPRAARHVASRPAEAVNLGALSTAGSSDRRAAPLAARNRKAASTSLSAASVAGSLGHRVVPHEASSRRAEAPTPGAILVGGSSARMTGRRGASATTDHGMTGRGGTGPGTTGRGTIGLRMMALGSTIPDPNGRAETGRFSMPVRGRTTKAAGRSMRAAMIVRSTAPRLPTPRAARSGCMACMRSPLRLPIPRAGCAAWW